MCSLGSVSRPTRKSWRTRCPRSRSDCIEVGLQVAEKQLSHGQGFLLGGEVTLADYYLLPSTYSFGRTPEGKTMYPRFPVVQAWRERMEALPTVRQLRQATADLPPIEHARKWAASHRPKY